MCGISFCADYWANIATVAGVLIAFFGLLGIYLQLRTNAIQAKRIRTYEFSAKIQQTEFYKHFAQCRYFLNDKDFSEDSKWFEYSEGIVPDLTEHVYITFAYFEDLGLSYNMNLIDRKIVKKLLKTTITMYYEESEWLRKRIKEHFKSNENIYKQWELMYKDLSSYP